MTTTQFSVDLSHLAISEALSTMKSVVEDFGPEFRYRRPGLAVYFNEDGDPSCLVGHVLARHGVRPEVLTNGPIAEVGPRYLVMRETVAMVLLRAQERQDVGGTWGEALAEAVLEADRQLLVDP